MHEIPEIDSHSLADLLQNAPQSIQLVDVREAQEWVQGVIEGAATVPLHLVPLQAEQWRGETRPMVIYCRSGARSAQACAFLAAQGGERQFINLRGGILDWARKGLPLVSPMSKNAHA